MDMVLESHSPTLVAIVKEIGTIIGHVVMNPGEDFKSVEGMCKRFLHNDTEWIRVLRLRSMMDNRGGDRYVLHPLVTFGDVDKPIPFKEKDIITIYPADKETIKNHDEAFTQFKMQKIGLVKPDNNAKFSLGEKK